MQYCGFQFSSKIDGVSDLLCSCYFLLQTFVRQTPARTEQLVLEKQPAERASRVNVRRTTLAISAISTHRLVNYLSNEYISWLLCQNIHDYLPKAVIKSIPNHCVILTLLSPI